MNEASHDPRRRTGWKPRSLRGRVLGAMLAIGLLPVLVLGGAGFLMERQRAVALELDRLSEQSQRIAVSIDKRLATNLNLARHLAISAEVISFLEKGNRESGEMGSMNEWLRSHAGLVNDLDAIFLVRPDGLCVASSQPAFLGINYAFRGYFQDALQGRYRLTDWQIGLKIQAPCVFVSQAVKKKGRILGVIVTRLDTSWIQPEFVAQGDSSRVVFLVNPDGILLAHSRPHLVYSAIRPIPPQRLQEIQSTQQFMGRQHPVLIKFQPSSIETVSRVLETGQPFAGKYLSDGTVRWVALRRLEEEPWLVGVATNERLIFSHSRSILLWSAFVGALMIGLVVLGGFWFSRRILRPLGRLDRVIHRFSSGEAGVRASEEGKDEVGRLAGHFNEMAETIQEQTEALAKRVDTLEGILPICASCRKIRGEDGAYQALEAYVANHTQAKFSHGLCEDCARKLYPDFYKPGGE